MTLWSREQYGVALQAAHRDRFLVLPQRLQQGVSDMIDTVEGSVEVDFLSRKLRLGYITCSGSLVMEKQATFCSSQVFRKTGCGHNAGSPNRQQCQCAKIVSPILETREIPRLSSASGAQGLGVQKKRRISKLFFAAIPRQTTKIYGV